MYAVAVGEMFDRVNFYGPFHEYDDAEDWAYGNADLYPCSWWVVELIAPREAAANAALPARPDWWPSGEKAAV